MIRATSSSLSWHDFISKHNFQKMIFSYLKLLKLDDECQITSLLELKRFFSPDTESARPPSTQSDFDISPSRTLLFIK